MSEEARKYSVNEMDDLRAVLRRKFNFGVYCIENIRSSSGGGVTFGRVHSAGEDLAWVEDRLRSHMLAGHAAQDLLDSERAEGKGQ